MLPRQPRPECAPRPPRLGLDPHRHNQETTMSKPDEIVPIVITGGGGLRLVMQLGGSPRQP